MSAEPTTCTPLRARRTHPRCRHIAIIPYPSLLLRANRTRLTPGLRHRGPSPAFGTRFRGPSTAGVAVTEWHGPSTKWYTCAPVVRSELVMTARGLFQPRHIRSTADFAPPFRPDANLARKLHSRTDASTAFRGIGETVRKWRRARRWLRESSPDCMKGTGHERHVTHYGTGREKRENRVWHPIVVAGSPVARRHSYCPAAVRMLNRGGRQPRFRIPHCQGTASLSVAAPGRR